MPYRPSFFAGVMATGIVALALRDDGFATASWALAVLAAVAYVVLVVLHALRGRRAPAVRGEALELFAIVAATEVLASLSQWHAVMLTLWALGLAAWCAIVPVALRTRRRPSERVRGSWLLATVGTDSVAVTGASLAPRTAGNALLGLSVALWLAALAVYCALAASILARVARRDVGIDDLHGDHWITMGALAISTLAGMHVLGGMAALHWAAGVRGAARVLGLVVWIGAACWLPALAVAEAWRLRLRPLYNSARWGTVFPLGMYAAASQAVARTAGVAVARTVFHMFLALAVVAWLATTAGFAGALVGCLRNRLDDRGRDSATNGSTDGIGLRTVPGAGRKATGRR